MSDQPQAGLRERAAELFVRERTRPAVDDELYRRCLKATRGLALAEALLLLVVGFTLDDLGLLRFPGYAVGALAAVLVLAVGRLVHARNLARRVVAHQAEDVQAALDAARLRNVLAAVGAVLAFVVWLVFFAAGVPPWML